jgi:hypothetical protein
LCPQVHELPKNVEVEPMEVSVLSEAELDTEIVDIDKVNCRKENEQVKV